jgi:poly(hydroxyalkanoate) depolymerase family esterase
MLLASTWVKGFQRQVVAIGRMATAVGSGALKKTIKAARKQPPVVEGAWIAGLAMGIAGARRYRLYRPPGVAPGERRPLMVMLHGCGQNPDSFAASTRMNTLARRERFLVLYPEQDRRVNPKGCWNWYDTDSRRAYGEVDLIMRAIDQACLLYPVDKARVAVAGLSAGASMAALMVTRHPERFKALIMHSGIPPGTAHSTLSALSAMHGTRNTPPLAAKLGTDEPDWPPLLVIHGTDDTVVSPENGRAAARIWAEAAGAKAQAVGTQRRGLRHPMSVTHYKRGTRTLATLALVDGLGHAWSGGTANLPFSDAKGPDASSLAWRFAARQFSVAAESTPAGTGNRTASRAMERA